MADLPPLYGDSPRATSSDDAELDRLVARSLAASERRPREAAPARASRWPWIAAGVAGAFAIGMVASPWFERQARGALPPALQDAQPLDTTALIARLDALERQATPAAPEPAPAPDPANAGTDARIATMEAGTARLQSADEALAARVDRLASEVATLSGEGRASLAQAQDLLLVAAVRRRFEAGQPLGPLEGPLEARIAPRDPAAVAAIKAWNAAPNTPRSLGLRLPTVAAGQPGQPAGWWDGMRARLSGLVEVRPVADRAAADREAEARAALARADVSAAVALMARQPETSEQRRWLADARRWVAAARALDRLEEGLLVGLPPSAPTRVPPPQ